MPGLLTGPKLSLGFSCLGAQGEYFSSSVSYGRKVRASTIVPGDGGDRAEASVDGPSWAELSCSTASP